eukprot:m.761 g.761  ORF g.761 m.761 type:complete len:208 (+) comp673_c0_seq1:41-664(+)
MLTENQQIGVELYEELQQRIPRKEVDEIVAFVKKAVLGINNKCVFEACGSYRRGKQTCGDVDLLISHRDPVVRQQLFNIIIPQLKKKGFLTHDLASGRDNSSTQEKYMGICKLPSYLLHRRIDIITVPWEEWPCAILYFTGSGHFNRSMRLLARKNGWSLNQHALKVRVIRKKNVKLAEGDVVPVRSEHDIFALLAISYRDPCERNA